mmetsp:Transcript_12077/g.26899  ORF Transcript_12077/g.26899 Transcript_12077/m.26899 type:complete len:692 (-) Transcript_12077:17-2092(-)
MRVRPGVRGHPQGRPGLVRLGRGARRAARAKQRGLPLRDHGAVPAHGGLGRPRAGAERARLRGVRERRSVQQDLWRLRLLRGLWGRGLPAHEVPRLPHVQRARHLPDAEEDRGDGLPQLLLPVGQKYHPGLRVRPGVLRGRLRPAQVQKGPRPAVLGRPADRPGALFLLHHHDQREPFRSNRRVRAAQAGLLAHEGARRRRGKLAHHAHPRRRLVRRHHRGPGGHPAARHPARADGLLRDGLRRPRPLRAEHHLPHTLRRALPAVLRRHEVLRDRHRAGRGRLRLPGELRHHTSRRRAACRQAVPGAVLRQPGRLRAARDQHAPVRRHAPLPRRPQRHSGGARLDQRAAGLLNGLLYRPLRRGEGQAEDGQRTGLLLGGALREREPAQVPGHLGPRQYQRRIRPGVRPLRPGHPAQPAPGAPRARAVGRPGRRVLRGGLLRQNLAVHRRQRGDGLRRGGDRRLAADEPRGAAGQRGRAVPRVRHAGRAARDGRARRRHIPVRLEPDLHPQHVLRPFRRPLRRRHHLRGGGPVRRRGQRGQPRRLPGQERQIRAAGPLHPRAQPALHEPLHGPLHPALPRLAAGHERPGLRRLQRLRGGPRQPDLPLSQKPHHGGLERKLGQRGRGRLRLPRVQILPRGGQHLQVHSGVLQPGPMQHLRGHLRLLLRLLGGELRGAKHRYILAASRLVNTAM